jgi:hypothetical protein
MVGFLIGFTHIVKKLGPYILGIGKYNFGKFLFFGIGYGRLVVFLRGTATLHLVKYGRWIYPRKKVYSCRDDTYHTRHQGLNHGRHLRCHLLYYCFRACQTIA